MDDQISGLRAPVPTVVPLGPVHTISVYVSNKPGVLARLGLVFSRRGYNIESIVVSPATRGEFSRMTITCTGDSAVLQQIIQQIRKMVDVVHATDHTDPPTYETEIALIKLAKPLARSADLLQLSERFNAKIIDDRQESIVLRVYGSSDRIDHCLRLLTDFDLVELVRSGKIVMTQGLKVR